MLLQNKNAVIYGGRVFLSGRNAAPVEAVANDIVASGGVAETATVDALNRKWRLTCGSSLNWLSQLLKCLLFTELNDWFYV